MQVGGAALNLQAGKVFFVLMQGDGKGLRRRGKFGSESVGLELRAIGEIAAADAGGKAEEVFDQ